MTTAAYVRVSTVGQNEAGQVRAIQRWLDGNGVDDVEWYVDKEGGDRLDRREFQRLQRDVFDGSVKTVILWKLDRLSRTIQDGLAVLCDWCERHLRVVSVTQQIDFNGTVGKMIAAVLFGVGQMEQEVRRERQAAGIEAAKAKGIYKGRRKGTTKHSPVRACQLRAKGLTIAEIGNALGVTRQTVHRYLASDRVRPFLEDHPFIGTAK